MEVWIVEHSNGVHLNEGQQQHSCKVDFAAANKLVLICKKNQIEERDHLNN